MKHSAILILAIASLPFLIHAQEEITVQANQSGYFRFLGAEILAKYKSEMLPIEFTKKRGFSSKPQRA